MLSPAWLHNYQGTEVLYGTWPLLRGIPQVPDDLVSGTSKYYVDALGHSCAPESQALLRSIGYREAVRMVLQDGILRPTLQQPLSRAAAVNVLVFAILSPSLAWGATLFVLLLACWGRVIHSKGPSKVASLAAEIDEVAMSEGSVKVTNILSMYMSPDVYFLFYLTCETT